MTASVRVALGSLAGAAVAAAVAPAIRPLFSPPTIGVGFVTVNGYPKSWDYAVVVLLVLGAFLGGVLSALGREAVVESRDRARPRRAFVWIASVAVFIAMLFVHDHPYAFMDPFHEGEHLTAGWLMKSGERPFGDFFVFHGLAVDAGLDALVLGDPPSPLRPRRLQTVLDAATLALLVPIAAEVTVTTAGLAGGVVLSLCAMAAFWLPVFPYFRMAPVLIAVLGLLRYARSGSVAAFAGAAAASTLGVLWSLDTGMYALAATAGAFVVMRIARMETRPLAWSRVILIAAVAVALPFLVLLAVKADIGRFLTDSFVIMPRAIDATWALPAPAKLNFEAIRYYAPPVFYGALFALAFLSWRRGDRGAAARIVIIAIFSLLMFRTAAGRSGWSHTRFSMPLLGIATVAWMLEPLFVRRRWLGAIALSVPLFFYFEVRENFAAGWKLLSEWPARQLHAGMVPYPFETGRDIYAAPANAADLAALDSFIRTLGPQDATILDFSNERALYYLLQRRPPIRCMEISMLSVPELLSEAMAELNANPPLCVIVAGEPTIGAFDGVSNVVRVPDLAHWIDANYPRRTQIGRFTVASR
jgi:hypothetical protein